MHHSTPLKARLCNVALLLGLSAGLPAWAGEASLAYTVTPNDTLIGLGRSLLVTPAAWPEVARLNALRNPNLITAGQTLQVPLRLLRSAQVPARIVSLEGDVKIGGLPARVGDSISPGQTLTTAGASSAVLQLGDGSRIKLAPLSDVALDEHRRFDLRPNAKGGAETEGLFASTMRLVRGSIEVLATKVLRAKPLEVTTPTAVIGVRGTEYRVHHENTLSGTEVLEGKVRADAVGAAGADVAAGFGAALQAGRAPEVVALAAAPDLSGLPARFERPLLRFALPGETTALRVQVAADPAFDHLVRDEQVAAGAEARIAGLDDGTWHLRARRIDARGIEGYNSQREISLKARPEPPAPLGASARAKMAVGRVSLAWAQNTDAATYRLEVARDPAFADVVHKAEGLTGSAAEASLAEAGIYHWRLASVRANGDRGPWGDAQSFELRPLPEPPAGGLQGDGKSLELSWSGRPQDKQQVELARDAAFTQIVAQAELTEARWQVPTPAQSGSVYFRYRAIEADGFVTPWSSTLKIEVPRDWSFLWLLMPLVLAL